jgi:RNA polymerase sigma factor, sigma-70 family
MGTELLIDTFCRLQKKLHVVANQLLKDEMEAEDAVQDAFCNLWSAELPETSDEARFRLFAILKNVCLNKLKRKRTITGIDSLDIAVESPIYTDIERLKKELIKHLTPSQREVFILSVYEEMEYEDIAEHLDISIEAVRMHMCRARKTVREQYKKLQS